MEKDNCRCVYPLTSLQIGDLQSYLSHRSLFLARESKRIYILVDNRPWLEDLGLRSAHLWQLMVTKSRLSPFANTKARKGRKATRELLELNSNSKSNKSKLEKWKRWFTLIDLAALSQKRGLFPVKKLKNSLTLNSKLHGTLHGLIIFEVEWSNVRGINYLNELQTDTSLAIETKCMKRWEFDSVAQAAQFIGSWFPGTIQEELKLTDYLDSVVGEVFYDAENRLSSDHECNKSDHEVCKDQSTSCIGRNCFGVYSSNMGTECSLEQTPPPLDGPYKRRKVTNDDSDFHQSELHSHTSYSSDCEDTVEATQYQDILILFRFNDRDLPFELREIITPDLKLLTLLEAGLPSWVIFLQSYPVFCHLYRPWMCPLARTLYVIVSIVTVLIGFYDLYKNVPVLKATAARLCGPLFDWIETWEMVTRIKYLGTMLFLQNFEKAVMWSLMVSRTIRSFLSVFTQPMAGPLMELLDLVLPFWNVCGEIFENFFSVISLVIASSFNLIEDLAEIILSPLWFILISLWNIAIFIIYPIFQLMWELLYAPVRLILGLANLIVFVCTCIYEVTLDLWLFASGLVKVASSAEATVSTIEVSMWRSLWNDLFSQVFRALRSILNGFVAFFAACNRHRLRFGDWLFAFLVKYIFIDDVSKGVTRRCSRLYNNEYIDQLNAYFFAGDVTKGFTSIYNHSRELTQKLSRPAERLRPTASFHNRAHSDGTQNLADGGRYQLKSKKKEN